LTRAVSRRKPGLVAHEQNTFIHCISLDPVRDLKKEEDIQLGRDGSEKDRYEDHVRWSPNSKYL